VARAERSVAGNAPGDLFVDDSCIACDTCRRFAPDVFGGGEDDPSFVRSQPFDAVSRRRALRALVSCPTASIGSRSGEGVKTASRELPVAIALSSRVIGRAGKAGAGGSFDSAPCGRSAQDERRSGRGVGGGAPDVDPSVVPDVLDCGYAAESSFGAASWLVLRKDGNVLVDSPRFARPLLERIRTLGGARYMFLTHRDDVADHARWAEALGATRVLHRRDVTARTREVELQPEGDAPHALAPDLLVIPVPGHTAGSAALLFRDDVLFTGDHLWGDAAGRLGASRWVCWFDWPTQLRSLEALLAHRFTTVLPGHGRPWRAETAEDARRALSALVAEASVARPGA
jgi:glyoxylase-like metal-dependent hydrolase (beta-lactamase superfamily II)/ferredoxin